MRAFAKLVRKKDPDLSQVTATSAAQWPGSLASLRQADAAKCKFEDY